MAYYRLRDIKTPPFAYVVNKEEAIRFCELCQMPFSQPQRTLEVEIFTPESYGWEARLRGKPLMAEEWLIGDAVFRDILEACLPRMFFHRPVKVVGLPGKGTTLPPEPGVTPPPYFYFSPANVLALDPRLVNSFPPICCRRCDREIPEIPLEYQRFPDLSGEQPLVASLEHVHLEGYDYLFHAQTLPLLKERFPDMLLEEIASETISY